MKMAERLDAALRGTQVSPPELSGMVHAARQLELLKPVPPMPAADLGAARQAFMAEAARLRREAQAPAAHLNEPSLWDQLRAALQPKAPRRSFLPAPALAAIVLVLCLMLALTGLDLVSHSALPGDGLYSYKLWREQVTTVFAFSPAQKVESHLRSIAARNLEINQLAQLGQPVPERTIMRLQRSLEQVLQAVTRLPDPAMQAKLAEIRQLSAEAAQALALIDPCQAVVDPQPSPAFESAAAAAATTQGLADLGLSDPDAFRTQMAAPTPQTFTPEATLVVMMPTATSLTVNLPPGQATRVPTAEATLVVMLPTATPVTVNLPPGQATPVPTAQPTLVVMLPTATAVTINLPPVQLPSATPTPTNPPPALPTATEVMVAPTQAPATPTCTCTPTATPEATQPPAFPTPTPVMQGIGE
jgi:hypothetical protein